MKNRGGFRRSGSGFYWVRFEGAVIVAEWRSNARRWYVPGSDEPYRDAELCEILSHKLEGPKP